MNAPAGVLALVTDAFGGRGGIARYNRDFFCALIESSSASSIVVLPRLAQDEPSAPPGIVQLSPSADRATYSLRALWAAWHGSADVVFCGHLYLAPLATLLARIKQARLIVQLHGIEAWGRPSRLQRAAIERADLVLCVSRYTRAKVLNWASISPEKVVVLPNTVARRYAPGDASAVRRSRGLDGKRVLLTVGRMDAAERYKGHELVIEAIPHLVAEGIDAVFLVIGEGSDRPRLESLARELGVKDRVYFGGAVDADTLLSAYRMADLFVMPSTGEGFGIAFLEAMACGTPALGLAAGGAVDPLMDGELGVAVAEDELIPTIKKLLKQLKVRGEPLAAEVHRRFGEEAYRENVRMIVDRLRETG